MIFSRYVLGFLNEGEIDMTAELTNFSKKIKNATFQAWFLDNLTRFAFKNKDLTSLKTVQFNDSFEGELLSVLGSCGVKYTQISIEKSPAYSFDGLNFRKSGKDVSTYWNSSGNKTNNQEIGVLIWVSILLHGKTKKLADFKNDRLKKFIVAKSDKEIEDSLSFLEKESLKKNGWNEQCKNSAEAIVGSLQSMNINVSNHKLHQGGSLFDNLRSLGKKLSGLSTADKWNPSDIYFIKQNINSAPSFKTVEELNSYLATFTDIIGVSLKGSSALHGAIALNSIFDKIKELRKPNVKEWKVGKTLTPEQKKEFKSLLNKVKSAAKSCPYEVNLYLSNKTKYNLSTNMDEMLNNMNISSENWGQSIPITLAYLAQLNTEQLWEKFIFRGYCLASSQTYESAQYLKADGRGHIEIIKPGVNEADFKCFQCRIPLSGETNVVFEAQYNGEPLKLQFRSKGSKPQLIIIKTQEQVKSSIGIEKFKF